ncbi:MAG: purine-nucleoside phosphorylase [Candidatus Izemoplasmataceae bacterium]
MYDQVKEAANYISSKLDSVPKTAMVLGSGLSSIVDEMTHQIVIPFDEIPYFQTASVKGHRSDLVIGEYQGTQMMVMTGRFHFYEGFDMKQVTFPIYVMKLLGIKNLILTNSCGGINEEKVAPGTIMVIEDFINFMPTNPLIGENDERFGVRFPDMTEPYSHELREVAKEAASKLNIRYTEGVYAGFMGPYYESRAEIRMLKGFGADVVGMSTVPETIVANYLGIDVLAFATVTNMATGIQEQKHSHEHVVMMAKETSKMLIRWLNLVLQEL